MAAELARQENLHPYRESQAEAIRMRWLSPFLQEAGQNIYLLRDEVEALMWEKAGLVRTGVGLEEAVGRLDELLDAVQQAYVENRHLIQFNMEWHHIIDVTNLITVSRLVANTALHREESRGAHYREDFPATDNEKWLVNIFLNRKGETGIELTQKPVALNRLKRDEIEKLT
jgi:succinate dehydrogenase/fumarate reductase flavoprotein subunit